MSNDEHLFTPSSDLRPRAGLAIAAIGNRRFAGENNMPPPADAAEHAKRMKEAAGEACIKVWEVISDEMLKTLELEVGEVRRHGHTKPCTHPLKHFFKNTREFKPLLSILTSLAAGADQIAAATAVKSNKDGRSPVEFKLQAVLPFPEEYYPGMGTAEAPIRKEFRRAEAEELRSLALKAEQVVRLDGVYEVPGEVPEPVVREIEEGVHMLREAPQKNGEHKSRLHEEARKLAYRSAAEMLRQNSDLLVAIYDPFAEGAAAGTLETVKNALGNGMPVVAILVKKDEGAKIAIYPYAPAARSVPMWPDMLVPLKGEDQWAEAWDVNAKQWQDLLQERIRYLMALPHMLPEKPDEEEEKKTREQKEAELHKRQELLADTVDRLTLFYKDSQLHLLCGENLDRLIPRFILKGWNWVKKVVWELEEEPRPEGLIPSRNRASKEPLQPPEDENRECAPLKFFRGTWSWINNVGQKMEGEPHYFSKLNGIEEGVEGVVQPKLKPWYDRASNITGRYMAVHRGFFVLAFLLAALAATTAVLAMAFSWWFKEPLPMPAVIGFSSTELLFIAIMLRMAGFSHRRRPHEIAVDFRYFAELMRPMEWLARLGASVPTVALPAHYHTLDPRQGWAPWLFRAIARSLPCVLDAEADGCPACVAGAETSREKKLDSKRAKRVLQDAADKGLQGQIHYHWRTTKKMHALHEGLHNLALGLAWAVAAIVLFKGFVEIVDLGIHEDKHGGAASCYEENLPNVIIVLSVLAAAFPAFAAAFTAILFQSEAARLTSRYEAMYERHHKIQAELKTRAGLIPDGASEEPAPSPGQNLLGSNAWISAMYLRSVAREMIVETGDWHALYRTHTVHAG